MAFTGFGLRDMSIADYPTAAAAGAGTAPTWLDVPGVESAAYKGEVEIVEVYGDDKLLERFLHTQKGTISVKANRTALPVIEKLTGTTVQSAGTGPTATDNLYFGTKDELNPPLVLVRATIPFRNEDGTSGELNAIFFRCQSLNAWSDTLMAERGKSLVFSVEIAAYVSAQDEKGEPVPSAVGGEAIGKLVVPDPA